METYPSIDALRKDRTWRAGIGLTGFDDARNYMGADLSEFVVGLSQSRDSDIVSRANFAACLETLGGESETVEVHRIGHWACGWVEQIMVRSDDAAKLEELRAVLNALADYPIVCESTYSEFEQEEQAETFNSNWEGWARDLSRVLFGDDEYETHASEAVWREFLSAVYADDCGYRGTDDAWVSERCLEPRRIDWELKTLAREGNALAVVVCQRAGVSYAKV